MDKKIQGKKNRQSGARFELVVRKDLEEKGWIVSKWMNNVECIMYNKSSCKDPEDWGECKLIPAKRKYNPFNKALSIGTGFPDFIALKLIIDETRKNTITIKTENKFTTQEDCDFRNKMQHPYEVIGVEVKSNGYLSREEKEKCRWLLENNIFSKILIAKKGKKRGEIIYGEFEK